MPPAPAASQVRVGFGAKPQGLVFCFEVVLKDTESVLFCVKKTPKPLKTPLIYRYRKRTIKSPMKSENNA